MTAQYRCSRDGLVRLSVAVQLQNASILTANLDVAVLPVQLCYRWFWALEGGTSQSMATSTNATLRVWIGEVTDTTSTTSQSAVRPPVRAVWMLITSLIVECALYHQSFAAAGRVSDRAFQRSKDVVRGPNAVEQRPKVRLLIIGVDCLSLCSRWEIKLLSHAYAGAVVLQISGYRVTLLNCQASASEANIFVSAWATLPLIVRETQPAQPSPTARRNPGLHAISGTCSSHVSMVLSSILDGNAAKPQFIFSQTAMGADAAVYTFNTVAYPSLATSKAVLAVSLFWDHIAFVTDTAAYVWTPVNGLEAAHGLPSTMFSSLQTMVNNQAVAVDPLSGAFVYDLIGTRNSPYCDTTARDFSSASLNDDENFDPPAVFASLALWSRMRTATPHFYYSTNGGHDFKLFNLTGHLSDVSGGLWIVMDIGVQEAFDGLTLLLRKLTPVANPNTATDRFVVIRHLFSESIGAHQVSIDVENGHAFSPIAWTSAVPMRQLRVTPRVSADIFVSGGDQLQYRLFSSF